MPQLIPHALQLSFFDFETLPSFDLGAPLFAPTSPLDFRITDAHQVGTGSLAEGKNVAHNAKYFNTDDELKTFRDRLQIPIPDGKLAEAPFYLPAKKSPEMEYLRERRQALGGYVPRRIVRAPKLEIPPLDSFAEILKGGGKEASPTLSYNRVWWQSPWGNAMWYDEVHIFTRPDVSTASTVLPTVRPEVYIPNGAAFAAPTIDGNLSDAAWAHAYSFHIKYGDDALRATYPRCIVMSARREGDIVKLREAIVAFFQRGLVEAELFLPWSEQKLRGQIFATCTVLEERAESEGAHFRVRGEREALDRLGEQLRGIAVARPLAGD
jgi:hypothetical protein